MFKKISTKNIRLEDLLTIFQQEKNINRLNTNNQSVLFYPTVLKYPKAVKFIIEKGIDINQRDNEELSALEIAISYGYKKTVELLLKKGAIIKFSNGYTTLILSVISNNIELINFFINSKNINQADNDGWTPLFWAIQYENVQVINLLLKEGANPNSVDNDSRTPIFGVCGNGNKKIFDILIKKGTITTIEDFQKTTPLKLAISYGHYSIVSALLALGTKINKEEDEEGKTLLDYAKPYKGIYMLLLTQW